MGNLRFASDLVGVRLALGSSKDTRRIRLRIEARVRFGFRVRAGLSRNIPTNVCQAHEAASTARGWGAAWVEVIIPDLRPSCATGIREISGSSSSGKCVHLHATITTTITYTKKTHARILYR